MLHDIYTKAVEVSFEFAESIPDEWGLVIFAIASIYLLIKFAETMVYIGTRIEDRAAEIEYERAGYHPERGYKYSLDDLDDRE